MSIGVASRELDRQALPVAEETLPSRLTERIEVLQQLQDALRAIPDNPEFNQRFWEANGFTDPAEIPDRLVVATSSYRKIILLALQLLTIHNCPLPDFYDRDADQPIALLKLLKRLFNNGNGECLDQIYIGKLGGVRIYSHPTEGETHEEGVTQVEEAFNKAKWIPDQHFFDDQGNVIYLGLDTMDMITREINHEVREIRLQKPKGDPRFPQGAGVGSPEFLAFQQEYIEENFAHDHLLTGVTAGVLIDNQGQKVATGQTRVSVIIDRKKIDQLAIDGELDQNASGWGILQYLVGWYQEGLNSAEDETDDELTPEQRRVANENARLFLLAQIMGAPMSLFLLLLKKAGHAQAQERVRQAKG